MVEDSLKGVVGQVPLDGVHGGWRGQLADGLVVEKLRALLVVTCSGGGEPVWQQWQVVVAWQRGLVHFQHSARKVASGSSPGKDHIAARAPATVDSMRNQPLSAEQVKNLLTRFPRADLGKAGAYLLSPLDVLVGTELWQDAQGWHYRGLLSQDTSLESLWSLLVAGHESTDEYLESANTLADLLKVLRSGSGYLVTGPAELAGKPNFYCRDRQSLEAVLSVVAQQSESEKSYWVKPAGLSWTETANGLLVKREVENSGGFESLSQKDAAMEAARVAARLRTQWGVGATSLRAVSSGMPGVWKFELDCVDTPERKASLLVSANLVQVVQN